MSKLNYENKNNIYYKNRLSKKDFYKVLSKILTKFPFFIHLYDYIAYHSF